MTRTQPENSKAPLLNVVGEFVALGPLRRDLVATYARWFNDFETLRTLNVTPPRPTTHEQELAWYDGQVASESSEHFTDRSAPTRTPPLQGGP